MISTIIKTGIIVIVTLSILGCDTYFGGLSRKSLPGKRTPILIDKVFLKSDADSLKGKIILPRPSENLEWPQAGGYPNHVMHLMKSNPIIKKVWSINVGEGADDEQPLFSAPILAENKIFTLDAKNTLAAFDAISGNSIWKTTLTSRIEEDDEHIGGGLAYASGKIFVTTGFAEIFCVDAKSGKIYWRRQLSGPFRSSPTVQNKIVFAVTLTNQLFALNAESGKTIWTNKGIEETTTYFGSPSPAVSDRIVVAAYSSGEIVALKIENGNELWTDSLSLGPSLNRQISISAIRGRPIIDRGLVFAISNSDQFTAIDLRTGQRIWTRNIGSIESPWVAGNFIFLITKNSELIALSRNTGKVFWISPLNSQSGTRSKKITWTGPILVSDRLIVVGSSGDVLSISPYDGEILGKIKLSDGIPIEPIVGLNTIYFLNQNSRLVAYR